ncbi:hypothetical protein ASE36_18930 [Rhizobium sp. Root274]|uniref:hypothetical protein n=1 Tax=unclassified Rhizobium TaxID=2613769 RepID=UPI000715991D|nr:MULTISPECIES: hypothetical protein [unclassified Rhizobium]KQW27044.1 hypothetical protein ASC71_20145 [Rhizobium sp. Root1240]KRD27894.1 hypothetical protein ASE36_18930 [Rhizobium sp. Root274]
MTTATPPAPYSTLEGALASGFATNQLHHAPGHDRGGFIVSAIFAFEAARPVDFEFVGNDPSSWKSDVASGKDLSHALAEQIAFYDEMIKANRKAMAASAEDLQRASNVMIWTVGVGAVFVAAYLAWQGIAVN